MMKTFQAAALLMIATVLMTFSTISFSLFPRPLSLSNPSLFVEALFLAGLILLVMSFQQLRKIQLLIPK